MNMFMINIFIDDHNRDPFNPKLTHSNYSFDHETIDNIIRIHKPSLYELGIGSSIFIFVFNYVVRHLIEYRRKHNEVDRNKMVKDIVERINMDPLNFQYGGGW